MSLETTLFLSPFPCSCFGSFLCFERSKSHSAKNLRLPLKEARVEKANSYPWIPGGGMAIEVSVDGKVGKWEGLPVVVTGEGEGGWR